MSRRWTIALVVAQAVAVLAGLLTGCNEPSPCDPGQEVRGGYCRPVIPDAAAPGDADERSGGEAGSGEAGQSAGSSDVGQSAGASAFGRTCATDADCVAPATFCAPQIFLCTVLDCEGNPAICPAGWNCLDVSAYAGRHMTMCLGSL